MAGPDLRIPVGVLVRRSRATSQWIDHLWQPVEVLVGEPEASPWTVVESDGDTTTFYAGAADLEIYRAETGNYRDNLVSGRPSIWVALRSAEAEMPYRLFAVTADPTEGEGYTQAGTDIVEAVPMPQAIEDVLAAFVAEHHVETPFFKRKRDRANPEALARRTPGAGKDGRQ